MMNEDLYLLLIYKQLKGELSEEERVQLNEWLAAKAEHRRIQEEVSRDWERSAGYATVPEVDVQADFERLRERMRAHKAEQLGAKVRPMTSRRQWMGWAAAIALLVVAGWWWMNQGNQQRMEFATTGEGAQTKVVLSDGTQVWINERSTLTYPEVFSDNKRRVMLKGEAYFEVKPDSERPFKIQSASTRIEVLGTAFNYRDYEEEKAARVLVKEGKVRFQATNSDKALVLTPREVGIFHKNRKELRKFQAQTMNAMSWQTGAVEFRNTPLKEVVEELEELFEVDIQLVDSNMEACLLTGRFPRATVKSVLENIAALFKMKLGGNREEGFILSDGVCE